MPGRTSLLPPANNLILAATPSTWSANLGCAGLRGVLLLRQDEVPDLDQLALVLALANGHQCDTAAAG